MSLESEQRFVLWVLRLLVIVWVGLSAVIEASCSFQRFAASETLEVGHLADVPYFQ